MKGKSLKPFHSKVVGVTQKNDDGSCRQEILKKCKVGEGLILVHEPNKYDQNAVKVVRKNGEQIGWLNKQLAQEIAPRLDKGSQVDCEINDLTGGGWLSKKTRGCNIKLTKHSMR